MDKVYNVCFREWIITSTVFLQCWVNQQLGTSQLLYWISWQLQVGLSLGWHLFKAVWNHNFWCKCACHISRACKHWKATYSPATAGRNEWRQITGTAVNWKTALGLSCVSSSEIFFFCFSFSNVFTVLI